MTSKTDLAGLKTTVDYLDLDKLKTAPAYCSKLSSVVHNVAVKKIIYNHLLTRFNAVDTKILSTSGLITKTKYDSGKEGPDKKIEYFYKKISSASGLIKNTDCNTKVAEIENKIPSATGLVTTTRLDTKSIDKENKIPDIITLATKAALNIKSTVIESKIHDITNLAITAVLHTKATEIESKIPDNTGFITKPKFNRLAKTSLDPRMKYRACNKDYAWNPNACLSSR